MKKGQGKRKGTSFEREICKMLSLWWTRGKRNDVFWRTSNSGGRATFRNKQGRATFGQDGDIQAIDPIGQPLINLCHIEIKRGYSKTTLSDLIEGGAGRTQWNSWIRQIKKGSTRPYFLLICKRDHRKALALFPWRLWKEICDGRNPPRFKSIKSPIMRIYQWGINGSTVAMPLQTMLSSLSPEHFCGADDFMIKR